MIRLPFENRIKATALKKSYLQILAVLLIIPLKTQISILVLLVGFVQGVVRKEQINVPFMKCFKEVTLRRSVTAIRGVL